MRIVIVGGGRPTSFVAARLIQRGHEVTLVTADPDECVRLASRQQATIVCGDGSDPLVLEDVGLADADIILAATLSDADNLVICQLATQRFHLRRALAIVNDPENLDVFRQLGTDAFSTTTTVASLLEQRVTFDRVMEVIPAVGGRVAITELVIDASSPAVGHSLAELSLPEGALVAVVARGDETIIPRGTTALVAGDRLLLVAIDGARTRAIEIVMGKAP